MSLDQAPLGDDRVPADLEAIETRVTDMDRSSGECDLDSGDGLGAAADSRGITWRRRPWTTLKPGFASPLNNLAAKCLLSALISVAGLAVAIDRAVAQSVVVQSITDSRGDDIMTDEQWRTLYTFDLDYHDSPTCLDECAAMWPPFEAPRSATEGGAFTIVTRSDGKRQWSYAGSPLYYYSKDKQRFDVRGDGVGGVWHYARLPGGND